MPRKKIEISETLEFISVLNDKGKLDKKLEPKIPDDLLLKLHRSMLLGRRFDERLLSLQRQGRIGTFAPIMGQEASQLGAVAALKDTDWMVPAFREGAAEVWRGRTLENIIFYYGGFNEGGRIEEENRTLPVAIPVGTQMLHAVGLGWGIRYRGEKEVVMTFFGDGATSEGDFHEALNMAGVFQTPVVFVCQNNHWAISIPRERQTRSATLAQKAVAYGMPGIQVDGNDILAVYLAATEAVERARDGRGPTLIECVTYRLNMHTTADDPKKYRKEEEVESWRKKDPIPRFQNYLKEKGVLSDADIGKVEEEIKAQIQHAVERAEEQMKEMGDPLDMFKHAYAEETPDIRAQREKLARELRDVPEEEKHG